MVYASPSLKCISKFPDYTSHLILMFSLQTSPIVAISLTDYPDYIHIFKKHLLAAGRQSQALE